MNLELVKKIADAVLYEGYMLYPYRASSVKNRQRFNWGALAPKSYSEAQKGTEACFMQTQCLINGDEKTTLSIKVRFLHLLNREIGKLEISLDDLPQNSETDYKIVQSLNVGDQTFHTWQEAVEREVDVAILNLKDVSEIHNFSFSAKKEIEPIHDESKKIVGVFVRTHQEISGAIEVQISEIKDQRPKTKDQRPNIFKLTVRIKNLTEFENAETKTRDEALLHSTVSTHTILTAQNGEFVSLLEPPDELAEVVAACENIKTYPVLAGNEGEKDCLLSSPIILYDYPQIAAESAGDLFDGAEIDEILTLRIMTMTDDEKREMRVLDERARQMLERTENMPEEQLLKMHGVMKGAATSKGKE